MQLKSIVDKIDAILPQTQCRRCDFSGCRPYAEAIAAGDADINQCPPGGAIGIQLLANLLDIKTKPLNPDHGEETPPKLAVIVEEDCIGCAKCILACPVDAIVGAQKQMHTVIESHCTGCELCIPPCPVDCIELQSVDSDDPRNENLDSPNRQEFILKTRNRFEARSLRLQRQVRESTERANKKREALRQRRLAAKNFD